MTLLGVMAAPAMKRSGYDIRLSAGAIAAGGTLGILIPPVGHADRDGTGGRRARDRPVRRRGHPGAVLSLLYIVYTLARSYLDPALGPAAAARSAPTRSAQVVKELVVRHRAGRRRDLRHARASSSPASRRRPTRARCGAVRGAHADARLPRA